MMLRYQNLAKLQTKRIVFENVIAGHDSATLEHLKELSSRRRAIEESINHTSSVTEAIAREMSGGSTSCYQQERLRLEQYLPLLENFISHADFFSSNSQMVWWTLQLKIRWSSALSSSSLFNLMGPKFFQIDNLWFELGMNLFLYGAILWERASELLPAEPKQSAFIFREAAGVFHYLAHNIIPSLQPGISAERPPEATSSVCVALCLLCLAESQAVYIRKAEEAGNASFSVLSKLHHGVVELLDESNDALCIVFEECNAISSRFLEFISSCRALHKLQSQKYLAEVLKSDDHVGIAIGVLRDALVTVEKEMPGVDAWKDVFSREIGKAADTLRKFERENEFVWHDKVPSADELPTPQGSKIVKIEPYQPKKWERVLAFKI